MSTLDRARVAMDERTRRLAEAPRSAVAEAETASVVSFAVHAERYAVETGYVREILRGGVVTPVPGTPAILLGVINLRGELLPAFDLGALLQGRPPAAERSAPPRILVLGGTRGEVGFAADTVHEVATLRIDQLRAPPASMAEMAQRYTRGVTDGAVVVLDGAMLLEDPRLFIGRGHETGGEPGR